MDNHAKDRAKDPVSMPACAAGCLLAVTAAATGLVSWTNGAERHLRGDFEGQGRDLSVLYAELPAMLIGLPAAALGAFTLVRHALHDRTGRGAGAANTAGIAAALLTVAVLDWACLQWLASTAPPAPEPGL